MVSAIPGYLGLGYICEVPKQARETRLAICVPSGSLLQFLPWLSSLMDCSLQAEINAFLPQDAFDMLFITAAQTNQNISFGKLWQPFVC